MNTNEIPDSIFREAVTAIDAGDLKAIEALLDEHPSLLSDRLHAGEGYFKDPYLLWFVAGNPVRNGTLPANVADAARTIIEAARRDGVASLPHQLGVTLGLVASGRVPRESGVQAELIGVLVEAGADPNGALIAALAHREVEAAELLIESDARMTLLAAVCLDGKAEIDRLFEDSDPESRHAALAGAALFGNTDGLAALISKGMDTDTYGPVWFHPHATALHHAVDSGRLDAVRVLVDAGASLEIRDRIYGGTPLDWAEHLGRPEIADFLRESLKAARPDGSQRTTANEQVIRSLVTMVNVADLPRSISFYEKLGLRVANSFAPDGGDAMTWAWLERGSAQIMLARASEPVVPEQQSVLLYVYFDDVAATKAALEAAGIETGAIAYPFYAPRGEFRVTDPDGYVLMVTHT